MSWPHNRSGDPHSPTVVLLHGFMGSSHDWAKVQSRLSERHQCVAPTLPGHAGSGPAAQSFDELSRGLLELLDSMRVERAHLAGYSMGGRLALHTAIRHPDRVSKLVLVSTSPGLLDPTERQARAAIDDRRARAIEDDFSAFLNGWYRLPLFESLRRHEAYPAMLSRRKKGQPRDLAAIISQLSPGRQPAAWPHLKSLSMPVMILTGALDEKYVALSRQMKEEIPDSRLEVLASVGHNPPLEDPTGAVEHIENFLAA